jgi:hypothetical protein
MQVFWPILIVLGSLVQSPNATISGTVLDPTGAHISGAQITVQNVNTGVALTNTANESGVYLFPSVPPGEYRLTAEAPGFGRYLMSQLKVDAGARMNVNVGLTVAAAAQSVEVTAAESPLLSVSASVGGVISGEKLVDLPLPDRDVLGLVLTQPGLLGDNFAGTRIGALNVTRQGVNVMDQFINSGVNSIVFNSTDAIDEVRVITSPNDAELGRGIGQVNLSERSGTNKFHGSTWETVRNSALNANDFFSNLRGDPRPGIVHNDYGVRVGGPIKQNRTFFHFDWEGQREVDKFPITATTYTSQARQGFFRFFPGVENQSANGAVPTVDLNGNPVPPPGQTLANLQSVNIFGRDPIYTGIDPTGTISRFLGLMPLPNDFRFGDGLNTAGFTWRQRGTADGDQFNVKVDHHLFNERHRISFSFTRESEEYLNGFMGQPFPSSPGGSQVQHSTFYALNVVSTFSPTKLNEFHAGAQRGHARFYAPWELPRGQNALPTISGVGYLPIFALATTPIANDNDPQGRISPLYVAGDTFHWNAGRHAIKFGGEVRFRSSNVFNAFFVAPRAFLGASFGAPIVGVTSAAISGLGPNEGNAQALLTDMGGSVAIAYQDFNASGGAHPTFFPMAQQRTWRQREFSLFIQDDFKLKPRLTLNLGVRYEYYGVPYDALGRTAGLVGGSSGLWGISGTSWADMYQPGLLNGNLTQVQLIGKNSQNPNTQLYADDWNNFAPVVGLSWGIPYFGKDKTVLRAGYSIGYELNALVLLDNVSGGEPGLSDLAFYASDSYLNLANTPLPLTPSVQPLQTVPVTDRSQNVWAFDNNLRTPYYQNWNLTIERELPGKFILDLRYVGTKGTKLVRTVNVNETNIIESGILDAFKATQAGGNAPLLDSLFRGFNLGLGTVNGRTVTGSQSARLFSETRGFFANNDVGGFANYVNTRVVNGQSGFFLDNAGLADNTITANPQFAFAGFTGNFANSTYHSFQIDANRRFAGGWTLQSNYTWSRTLGEEEGDSQDLLSSYRNGRNRHLDKRLLGFHRTHVLRNSAVWELPFGSGKPFLSSRRGIAEHLLEGWKLGAIYNVFSGDPIGLASTVNPFGLTGNTFNQLTFNTPVLVGPLPVNGHAERTANGVIYFNGLQQVPDPSVASLTMHQGLQGRSQLRAVADSTGRLIAVNPAPGAIGSMSPTTIYGPSSFRLDIDMMKRVRLREGVDFILRGDAINVLNRPVWGDPDTDINSPTFGRITTAGGNRAVVVTARVSF